MNVENYVRSGQESRQSHLTSKMTWDLANMNLSDDSTSESAIYQDGSIIRKKQLVAVQRKTLATEMAASANREGIYSHTHSSQLSPAKSQSSIYDSTVASTDKALEKENVSSSSGFGASSSLYDIAPFRGNKLISVGESSQASGPNTAPGRPFDSNNNSLANKTTTALLLTGIYAFTLGGGEHFHFLPPDY